MSAVAQPYRQPMWGPMEPALRNCFIGAGIIGLALLITIYVVPMTQRRPVTVEDVPDRIAKLILEKPKPAAPRVTESVARVQTPKAAPATEPAPAPAPIARVDTPRPRTRREPAPTRVAPEVGTQGREKATREVTQQVAQVSGSLDRVLESVSKSLPASTGGTEPAAEGTSSRRSRRQVRSGRGSDQIASVGGVGDLSSADVAGSGIQDTGISVSTLTDLAVSGGSGTGEPRGTGTGAGSTGVGEPGAGSGTSSYRSNEALLAVVRRYAAGIQFCYDHELRKQPGLRGKLVVSMVVLANGSVNDATVIENTLGSPAVTECVLAQIRVWQFPSIPSGTTSFRTPFVFTPPAN